MGRIAGSPVVVHTHSLGVMVTRRRTATPPTSVTTMVTRAMLSWFLRRLAWSVPVIAEMGTRGADMCIPARGLCIHGTYAPTIT